MQWKMLVNVTTIEIADAKVNVNKMSKPKSTEIKRKWEKHGLESHVSNMKARKGRSLKSLNKIN